MSTGSASNAAFIASTNPASVNTCASRAFARSTNPADTFCPNNIATRVAARSVGTFPKLVNATAAAFSTGPKLIPFTSPPTGTAVVIFPQQVHLRCGSANSVRHGTTLTSHCCDHAVPPSWTALNPAPHPRHSAGGSSRSRRCGSGSRTRPRPG